MTVISQLAKGINDLFLGRDCNNMMPLLVHPQEILDGFLLGGMGLAGQALTTYDAQNHPMIKRLCQEHG
ncbi:glycine/sarcosine/betaine reductase component B subunit, partial [Gemmiger formicilis]